MNANPTPEPPAAESLLTTLRSFPRPLWVLFAGIFLNKFGTFVVPFLTIYLTRRGFSSAEAGLALGAYGAGRIAAAVIGGHLADTLGRRPTIVLSMTLAAFSMVLLSQAETLPMITALTGLASLTGEMYMPACTALLADLTPERRRVTVYATFRIAFNAGWAFGPATAAFIATHSFTWLFFGDAFTSLLFAGIAWGWLPRGSHTAGDAPGSIEVGWGQAAQVLRRDGHFLRVALATLLIGIVIHQTVSSYGLYITSLGLGDAVYGSLLSFNGLVVMLCELPLTRLTRHYPKRVMMAVGYLLMGLGLTLNLVLHTVSGLFFGMLVLTLGEMVFAPMASAYVAGLAPAHLRGRYMGGWAMANSLSLALAPSVGLAVFALNPAALWLGCGVAAVFAALIILGEPRRREPSADPQVAATQKQ